MDSSTTRMASVPPADAPMAISRSVVRKLMPGAALGAFIGRRSSDADARTRERAAILTLLRISSA
ncbi:hypothetical protein D3C81_1687560 [compost metagenome]